MNVQLGIPLMVNIAIILNANVRVERKGHTRIVALLVLKIVIYVIAVLFAVSVN